MKVICGLGNPGSKYEKTRHNTGFLFLDFLQKELNFPDFKVESKFFGEVSEGNILGEKIIFLKPTTFMNLSGKSVQAILSFYKIGLEDFLVAFDDKDLEFGKIRFREKGSAGGHNGTKDLIKQLGNEEFSRLKVGIKDELKLKQYGTSDFVLANYTEEEFKNLGAIFKEGKEKFEEWFAK